MRRVLLVASTILIAAAAFARWDPIREGLNATYFADLNWSSAPVLSTVEPRPSSENLYRAWNGAVPDNFSATWSGKLIVFRSGTYTIATDSDDGSAVYIDQQLVVDNGGRHEAQRKAGTIRLLPGDHDIFIKYFQAGGAARLELSWAREGSALARIPTWALVPRHAEFRRLALSAVARWASPFIAVVWVIVAALSILVELREPVRRIQRSFVLTPELKALTLVVAASVILSIIGVWWGIPSEWAGDEIGPIAVLGGIEHKFSGGWFDRYPPLHIELLSVLFTPLLILHHSQLLPLSDVAEFGVLLVISRLLTVVAAAGTVVALFGAGREAFGARAGVFAAAAFAVLTPFLYYAKTANPEVPYVFWFAISLVFFIRVQRTLALRDFIGFASAAVLSICTKDQAYGLYLLTPVALIYRLWESQRSAGSTRPMFDALVDRRLWTAFAAAVALFVLVHNIAVNPSGFLKHVRDIIGPGQQGYQMVDASIEGRFTLVRIAADLNQRSWGWPMWAATLIGFGMAVIDRSTRRVAILLTLVVVSYYLGFINVVRYAFDRYLLPVCAVEALFIGLAFDRLLNWSKTWARSVSIALALVFAYTGLYAGTVDVLMVRDGRYAAEDWLRQNNQQQHLVGIMFPATVLPRLRAFDVAELRTVDDLESAQPAFFLLNADYARAVPANTPEAALARGLQQHALGYRLAFRSHTPPPWPWLPAAHPNLVGPRHEVPVLSVLTEVNPTIEIYQRDDRDR